MVDPTALRTRLQQIGTLTLDVAVIPRASSSEVSHIMLDGTLKVKVTAAPEKGRANDEVCELIADFLAVPKKSVAVILGHTSRRKRVRILS